MQLHCSVVKPGHSSVPCYLALSEWEQTPGYRVPQPSTVAGLNADLRPFGYCCFKQIRSHPLQRSTLTPAGRWSSEASCCDPVVCGLLINHVAASWCGFSHEKPKEVSLCVCVLLSAVLSAVFITFLINFTPSRATQLSHQTTSHLSFSKPNTECHF